MSNSQDQQPPAGGMGARRALQRLLGLDGMIGRSAAAAASQAAAMVTDQIVGRLHGALADLQLGTRMAELRMHVDARTAEVQREQQEGFRQLLDNALGALAQDADARLRQHLAEMHATMADMIAAERSTLLQEMHRQLSDLDTRLSNEMHRQLSDVDTRLSNEMHRQLSDLNTRLSNELHRQLSDVDTRLSNEMHRQLSDVDTRLSSEMHRLLSHVDAHLSAHLSKELSLQLGGSGSTARTRLTPALLQERLLTLGRLLEPGAAIGVAKRRMGHSGDGGYVMLDDLADVHFALSLGVGAEMTWDVAMADLGIEVHQFDYTIEAPPEAHERVRFHRSRIGPVQAGTDHSLGSAQALGGNRPCIIKMDIEGDEWSVLEAAGEQDFDRVAQLIVEFHDFDRIGHDEWYNRAETVLRRLTKTFQVVHVHANNNGLLTVQGNVAFPEILEVTFGNRSRYTFGPSTDTFPTSQDAPNRADLPDIVLGTFRF